MSQGQRMESMRGEYPLSERCVETGREKQVVRQIVCLEKNQQAADAA